MTGRTPHSTFSPGSESPRRMRILVLCYEYPPLGGGGGRVAQTVARELVARGHEVRVQTAALGWSSTVENDAGVEVTRTASGRARPEACRVHEMGLYCATSFWPTLRHIHTWRPDVIHAHFAMPTGMLAWAAHRLTGVPYVLTAHLGDVPGGVPGQTDELFALIDPIARAVWRDAAAATAVSSFVQTLAEGAYERPVERILNGIHLHDAPPPRPPAPTPHLVFLGRFNAQKNAPLLIEALALVRDLPWRLTMIGDGPEAGLVDAAITHHRLSEKITRTGWLNAGAVADILSAANVLCMPSLSEGMPVAAVEALKNGLALITSDIPGVCDVVHHGDNGLTAPVNDAPAFAAALRGMLTQPGLLARMQQASRAMAQQFALPEIIDAYERALQSAAAIR